MRFCYSLMDHVPPSFMRYASNIRYWTYNYFTVRFVRDRAEIPVTDFRYVYRNIYLKIYIYSTLIEILAVI